MPCDIPQPCPAVKFTDEEKRRRICDLCQKYSYGGVADGETVPEISEVYRKRAMQL